VSDGFADQTYSDVFLLDMGVEKTTTVRMENRTLKRIDGLAHAMSRSRAWVINQAVERYLDYEEWFVGEVKHALKQVEAGEVLEHSEVVKR